MPLGLSPYVTSTSVNQDAWCSRRVENDRPSPLRISKQLSSTDRARERPHQQQPAYSLQETAPPLQARSANCLNITKRRSLWALSAQRAEDEQVSSAPPRPYSVGPNTTVNASPEAAGSNQTSKSIGLHTAEEAEEMLREASRTYSGASNNSYSWNSFVSGGCSVRKSSGTRSSASVVRQVSSSTDGPSCTISMDSILPHVLSPHISIHTNGHGRYFGQNHVWAAIEVSGILSHAYSADGTGEKPTQPKQSEHHLDLFFKHGCLHDLKVQILPVEGTTVLEVFHEQSFPTILYAGSKVLILAQIGIDTKSITRHASKAHQRHKSDELIADLESQLGDSQMPYMKVRITYSHSAFSDYFGHEILVGVAQRCTKLETTAVGALKRHNVRSAWSPPPIYSLESIKSAMERHWEGNVVAEWLQKMERSARCGGRVTTKQSDSSDESQDATSQVLVHRPDIFMEDMCRRATVKHSSERHNHLQSSRKGGQRRELKQVPNMGSPRSRGSRSRNISSSTTTTTGSLRKNKSFAAGIWRTLTPSVNAAKADGHELAQGAWNWNAWF